jgi:catechol 2,3-dioxygenase-like lactoylglutathione lyase family enzyme
VGAFGEMVNAGVKRLALSEVMSPAEMDAFLPEAQQVAERNKVRLYRERDLLVTDLFPADVARGKDVLLIYQDGTLDEYLALKAEAKRLEQAGQYVGKARETIARRFGRMLSYPAWRINELLAAQTDFRTMQDFGIRASNLFLYYRDLDRATAFYRETLGMELVADYEMARIFRMTADSYLILVDAARGMHTADAPHRPARAVASVPGHEGVFTKTSLRRAPRQRPRWLCDRGPGGIPAGVRALQPAPRERGVRTAAQHQRHDPRARQQTSRRARLQGNHHLDVLQGPPGHGALL